MKETEEGPPSLTEPTISEEAVASKAKPQAHSVVELEAEFEASVQGLRAMLTSWASRTGPVRFMDFEGTLAASIWAVAQAAMVLFLALRDRHVVEPLPIIVEREGRRFRRAPAIVRRLTTMFGVIHYGRTYMREVAKRGRRGFFPLDLDLGLTSERFSWNVLSSAAWLATKLSFAEARTVLGTFIPHAPSTEVIEQVVIGLGRHTAEWFESAPAPEGDGEVLIMMFDSKGAPTATEEELRRRRGKRKKRRKPASPRHRGRARRRRHPKKARRKKGDKSKNAKMATMFVMYTLKRHGGKLLGPINRRVYASFAPKRHAFVIARREADKRGFTEGCGKTVQIVTDGDDDLEVYTKEFFPTAEHTIDVVHVVEKLWTAGECLHREGTDALRQWVEGQKDRLYQGGAHEVVEELQRRLDAIPKTGPGNKGKRARLEAVTRYLRRRLDKMPYDKLLAQDLEISTGAIEGGIKNIIGKRFDHGGMRWIKERAEALLQLRCIDANGDWCAFSDRVHERMHAHAQQKTTHFRLQSQIPTPLPALPKAA